jgi:MFS transporter, DHA1 family, multidrug resistance protein
VSAPNAPQSRGAYLTLALLLASLSMISPFSIDTFFPAFRAMESEFGVTTWQMQQTLTAYLLPYALMSIVQGPLSDALGRRRVVIGGIACYTVASLACVWAPSFGSLLLFRAAQGVTAGVGMVVGRAIIRDLYDGPKAQRLMAAVSLIFGIAPAIAPIIGGWIHVAFGWRAVFAFLAIFGALLTLATALRLPETHPLAKRIKFAPAPIVRACWQIASRREFTSLALAAGLNFCGVFCFIGAAPAVVLDHWRLTETQFAWLFLPVIAGFTLGAVVSGRVAGTLAPERQVRIGMSIVLGICIARAAVHAALPDVPIVVQQAMLFVSALGTQLVFPALTLRMLDMFPDLRGSAASVQSFVSLVLSSAMVGVVVPLAQRSLQSLSFASMVAVGLAVLLWARARPSA